MKCITFCACDDNTGTVCIVRAVEKFDSRIVTNETSNKCRPMESKSYNDSDLLFSTGSVFSSRPSSRVLKVCPDSVQVNRIPLSNEHYIYYAWHTKSVWGRGTHRSTEQRNVTSGWNLRCVPKDIKSAEVRERCKPRPRGIATWADRPEFDVIFVLVCGAFVRPQTTNITAQCDHFYSY